MFRFIWWLFRLRRRKLSVKTPSSFQAEPQTSTPELVAAREDRFKASFAPRRNLKIKWQPRPPPDFSKAYKRHALSDVEARKRSGYLAEGRVLQIVDGDTVVIMIGREENLVRLDSIDCPEGRQPWGEQASNGLRLLIEGRLVGVEQHGQDPYGRSLATIYAWHDIKNETINVNEYMVMRGHAWVMRHYYDHLPVDRQQRLVRMERWARTKKIGLWNEINPIPPWKWRKGE